MPCPGAKDTDPRLHNRSADSSVQALEHRNQVQKRRGCKPYAVESLSTYPCFMFVMALTKTLYKNCTVRGTTCMGMNACCATSKTDGTCSASKAPIRPLTVHPPRSGLPHSQGKCPVQEGPAPRQIPAHHIHDHNMEVQGKRK